MAWIYLAESEDLQLPLVLGLDQSPIVSEKDSPQQFFSIACLMDLYQKLQSSQMSESLEVQFCQASTSFMGASPARMLAVQELERAWMDSEPAYSVKQFDLFENVNLSSYSSKMCQESENMCLSSGKSLRRLATIVEMDSCPPAKWGPNIEEIDGGSWAPTPRASEGRASVQSQKAAMERMRKSGGKKQIDLMTLSLRAVGKPIAIDFIEKLMGYPTQWTVLEDWAMQWFPSKQEKLLKD